MKLLSAINPARFKPCFSLEYRLIKRLIEGSRIQGRSGDDEYHYKKYL